MAKINHQKPPKDAEELPLYHLGSWLARLGLKQADLAKETGFNEGYISQLVHQEKRNPSFYVVAKIADALEITIDQLRHPPPTDEMAEALRSLDATLIDRIRRGNKKPGA
jgi:transcriptional regulator with XRE-family HTH domain